MRRIIYISLLFLLSVATAQYNGVNINKYGGTNTTLGQKTSSASVPVVISSDQSSVATTTNGTVFTFSTVNSSTAQLAASATFTGTVESVVNQQSYSVLFFSDQNATITIKQYIDAGGTKLISSLPFTYVANAAFARSGVMNGNYINVVVQNTGGSTTTTLQLDVAYGTIPSATQLNNAPCALNEVGGTSLTLGQKDITGSIPVTLATKNYSDSVVTGQAAQTALVNNILTTTAGATATDLIGYRSALVQLVCPAGTYTTGAVIFEGSNDNTNFQTIPVYSQLILTGTPITAAITLVTTTSIGYTFPVNFRYIRCRISTAVSGASASVQAFSKFSIQNWTPGIFQVAQATAANLNVTATGTVTSNLGTGGTAATSLGKAEDAVSASGDTGPMMLLLRNDALTSNVSATGDYIVPVTDLYGAQIVKDQQRHKRTYSCAFVVSPAATATDVFQLIGSATTTVEVTKITISGTQTTGGMADIYIKKRSTANTGGTSSASTNVPHISTDAAATAVGAIYTANPTTGTDVGNVRIFTLPLSAVTATTLNVYEVDFGEKGKPIILSGVAQAIAINLNGVTITGGSLKISVEFTEY